MKKRALSFFLMLIMVFALLPISAYAKYTYDPAKAIAWATNKTEFDKYGGKCAAFVSRCLREGGLKDVSYSEPGAMVSFLEKSDYGTTYRINDANLKKLKAGDVVMVYCGKGHDKSKYWGLHTIFVTAVDQKNKKFTYCAKNESRFCVTKTFGYLKNYASYIKCNRCGSSSNSVGVFVSMNTTSQTPKQKYTLLFDGNSGSGSMSNQVVTMGDKFALPSCTFTREGYRCIGWNVCRNADKTWYVAKHGWLTQQQITEQKLEKKLYANDSSAQYVFDSSWTQGCSTVSTYTFHAVWEQLPHAHNYVRQERPATCTQDGFVKYVCACGSSYNEAVYPALGHDWDSGTVTTPATCTGKGVRTYTCTSSSHTKTEDIPALNHSFAGQEYVSDNNATCEQDGTKTAKCVRYGTGGCMATDTVTDTDSKLGHLFENYVSNNDATYGRDGTKTAKCVRYDQCGETHTVPDEGSRLKLPLYRVTDKDGRDIAYTAEQTGGVLTVTVDEDLAILTGRLSGIRTLKAQGVEKIVFVTKGATSAFLLSDLLDKGEGGEAYRLTHNGKAVTFTLGESMADVSAILIKP